MLWARLSKSKTSVDEAVSGKLCKVCGDGSHDNGEIEQQIRGRNHKTRRWMKMESRSDYTGRNRLAGTVERDRGAWRRKKNEMRFPAGIFAGGLRLASTLKRWLCD